MRRNVSIGVAATLVLGIVALGAGQKSLVVASTQKKKATTEMTIDNFSFGPTALTVQAETTVTWTNRDDIPHTMVSTDDLKTFKSKVLDTDQKFSFTFSKAGSFPYF
jgi:plastocyanin